MNKSIFIIAEAGVNHNGSIDTAIALIDAAVAAGADAVKFQTFKAEHLVTKTAEKAAYQKHSTGHTDSQYSMLKALELQYDLHYQLRDYCQQHAIKFLSTAFDFESLTFLVNEIGIDILKIPSGEITNGPFLLAHAQTGLPIILSTGMANLAEIETALGVLAFGYLGFTEPNLQNFQLAFASSEGQNILRQKVTLLHCTTQYPTPAINVNLRSMDTLQHAFALPVGYSDHTEGLAVPLAAAARGALVIEKHFTLDRSMQGPDHQVSLEPAELKQMVSAIRTIEIALGSAQKTPQPEEFENRLVSRKSLVAGSDIAKGELYSSTNVKIKRPGSGISPMAYWDLLGTQALQASKADHLISR